MNFLEELAGKAVLVDRALNEFLPPADQYPPVIHEAMRYSLFAGGKRLRPALVMAAAEAVGGSAEAVMPAACALELIHTYSLIHDDLPAMDNDELRRGKPTSHVIYGEAIAILAGDALLTVAFELMAGLYKASEVEAGPVLQAIAEIAGAAGTMGMIGGQVADLLCSGREVNTEPTRPKSPASISGGCPRAVKSSMDSTNIQRGLKPPLNEVSFDRQTLEYIHSRKTGALYRASVRSGAILSGATPEHLASLTTYATNLGLAFQIVDDILDVAGDEKKLGKPVGSDARNDKATYPALYGMETSRNMALQAGDRALAALEVFGGGALFLRSLVHYVLKREN